MIHSNNIIIHFNADADKPLIIFQLIDSPVHYHKDVNQTKQAKIKVILILAFIIMCLIRLMILLFFNSKSEITNYFGDILILFGNLSFYLNLITILILFEVCLMYHLFYFSPQTDMKWFAILSIFKGIEDINQLGIKNKFLIKRLISRFIFIKNTLFRASIAFHLVIIVLYYISYYFSPLNNGKYLIWKIFWLINDMFYGYFILVTLFVVYIYYYLICYKIKLQLIDLKIKIDSTLYISTLTSSLSTRTIIKLFKQKAQIEMSIGCYNRFWKKYFMIVMFPSIPAHAMLVFLFISYKMNLFSFVLCVDLIIGLTLYSVFIFIPLFKINSQFKSLYKSFYQLLMYASLLNHSEYELVLIMF